MTVRLIHRLLTEVDTRLLGKFLYCFGWKGMLALRAFERRQREGRTFPAFLFLSIQNIMDNIRVGFPMPGSLHLMLPAKEVT